MALPVTILYHEAGGIALIRILMRNLCRICYRYTDYLSYDKAVAAGVDMCEQADIGASLSTSKIAKAGA